MFDQIIEFDHFVNTFAQIILNKQTAILIEYVFGVDRCFRVRINALGFGIETVTWMYIQKVVLMRIKKNMIET